jgi:hypothetical protein
MADEKQAVLLDLVRDDLGLARSRVTRSGEVTSRPSPSGVIVNAVQPTYSVSTAELVWTIGSPPAATSTRRQSRHTPFCPIDLRTMNPLSGPVATARSISGIGSEHGEEPRCQVTPPSDVAYRASAGGSPASRSMGRCAQPWSGSAREGSTSRPAPASVHVRPPSSLRNRHVVGVGPVGSPAAPGVWHSVAPNRCWSSSMATVQNCGSDADVRVQVAPPSSLRATWRCPSPPPHDDDRPAVEGGDGVRVELALLGRRPGRGDRGEEVGAAGRRRDLATALDRDLPDEGLQALGVEQHEQVTGCHRRVGSPDERERARPGLLLADRRQRRLLVGYVMFTSPNTSPVSAFTDTRRRSGRRAPSTSQD